MSEGLDGAVDAALELLVGQLGELPLDQVQPGRAGQCEVQLEARTGQRPLLDRLGLAVGDAAPDRGWCDEVEGCAHSRGRRSERDCLCGGRKAGVHVRSRLSRALTSEKGQA
jgi:hypothetical protein